MILLILGAVTNLAVAWGSGSQSSLIGPRNDRPPSQAEIAWWRRTAIRGFPERPTKVTEFSRPCVTEKLFWAVTEESNLCLASRWRCGWPLPALERSAWSGATPSTVMRGSLSLWIPWASISLDLPIHPLWMGIVVNVIVHATGLWAIMLGGVSTRRIVRRYRGLCANCAYDLRNMTEQGCPECGWGR